MPDELPKVLVAEKPRKTWPDAFEGVNGIPVVSGRAKDVIERFDPDLDQFFELPLRTKRGVEIEGPWCIMNVTLRQSSLVVWKSRVLVNDDVPDTHCSFYSTSHTKDIVADTSRLSPAIHFWREACFRVAFSAPTALSRR